MNIQLECVGILECSYEYTIECVGCYNLTMNIQLECVEY